MGRRRKEGRKEEEHGMQSKTRTHTSKSGGKKIEKVKEIPRGQEHTRPHTPLRKTPKVKGEESPNTNRKEKRKTHRQRRKKKGDINWPGTHALARPTTKNAGGEVRGTTEHDTKNGIQKKLAKKKH